MSDTIELLKSLVAIDSVNPDLVHGAAGETTAAAFIMEWFRQRAFELHRIEDRSGRPSIVAIARGTGAGRTLLFDGHLDTVGVQGYDGDPFAPRIENGRLFGRGSQDMKSGVAAMMIAADRAARARLAGDVIVACVADEEYASIGTEAIARLFKADAAIIPEPTGLAVTIAHKGFVWFDVLVKGRAAHGSRPDLGIDAIVKTGKFLVVLDQEDRRLRSLAPHPLLGTPSVHASLIQGGQELSSYPAECMTRIERRTVPGETPETVDAHLRSMLNRLEAQDADFNATLTRGLARNPMEVPSDAPIVPILLAAATNRLGRVPTIEGMSGWTDCALLADAGIPSILFGPTGAGLHGETEYVEIESVDAVADILFETAVAFCSHPKA
jgi:acetylornithine deacetylase